jgi:hypothetical protein
MERGALIVFALKLEVCVGRPTRVEMQTITACANRDRLREQIVVDGVHPTTTPMDVLREISGKRVRTAWPGEMGVWLSSVMWNARHHPVTGPLVRKMQVRLVKARKGAKKTVALGGRLRTFYVAGALFKKCDCENKDALVKMDEADYAAAAKAGAKLIREELLGEERTAAAVRGSLSGWAETMTTWPDKYSSSAVDGDYVTRKEVPQPPKPPSAGEPEEAKPEGFGGAA